MTNRQYLLAQIGFAPSDGAIEAALADGGMLGTDIYQAANIISVKTAAISVIKIILTTPDTSQGQGETRNEQRYDRPSLLKLLDRLEEEIGIGTGLPTIKGIHPW